MGINFNSLPKENASMNVLVPEGQYFVKIMKAEMKQPKDPAKKAYLNMFLELKDKDGKVVGKIYDIIAESDHEFIRYKLRRFIEALQIPIEGEFELADLAKIVTGKELIAEIVTDTRGDQPKSVVGIFTDKIFYPLSDANKIFGGSTMEINAADAADSEAGLPWGSDSGNKNY